jgi:hypothetical protein
MYKIHFFALSVLLILLSCNEKRIKKVSGHDVITLSQRKLKGKVKKLTEYLYAGDSGQRQHWMMKEVYLFDPDGYETESASYHSSGAQFFKLAYTYGSKHEQVKAVRYFEDDSPKTTHYTCNSLGYVTEENTFLFDKTFQSTYLYKYDNHGNMIEQKTIYKHNGSTDTSVTGYFYDDKDQLVKTVFTDLKRKTITKTTCSYNAAGNTTETCKYGENDSLEYRFVYEYDHDDNIIRSHGCSKNILFQGTSISTYGIIDRSGNYLSDTTYKDGKCTGYAAREIEYY